MTQPAQLAGRRCIFCGGAAGSAEHVFPNWINQVFPVAQIGKPEAVLGMFGRDGQADQKRWSSSGVATQTVKEVCRNCNTGWMSRLEAIARPLIIPMATGVPTTLALDEQIVVATWATKTAMTAELVHGHDYNFSSDDRAIVMSQQRPPAHVAVTASAIETSVGPCRFVAARGHILSGVDTIEGWIHVYTIQVGTLVLQVMRSDPPMGGEAAFKTPQVAAQKEIPLYPPTALGFFWPPPTIVDEAGFIAHTQREGSDIPIESFMHLQAPFDPDSS